MARRPYRVVFWSSASTEGKPGTIVRVSLDAARTEAQAIAADGGTAEVRYVSADGQHQVLATYRPPPVRETRHVFLYDPPVPGVLLAGICLCTVALLVWSRRRRRPA